jgi:hypothetical protein
MDLSLSLVNNHIQVALPVQWKVDLGYTTVIPSRKKNDRVSFIFVAKCQYVIKPYNLSLWLWPFDKDYHYYY